MRLLNGTSVPDDAVTFDYSTYHLFYGDSDITNLVSRTEKIRLIPNFDIEKDNYRLSVEKPVSGGGRDATAADLEDLEDNTAVILGDQLLNDPFSAPLESANRLAEKFLALPGLKKLMIVAAVGAVLYIAVKKS